MKVLVQCHGIEPFCFHHTARDSRPCYYVRGIFQNKLRGTIPAQLWSSNSLSYLYVHLYFFLLNLLVSNLLRDRDRVILSFFTRRAHEGGSVRFWHNMNGTTITRELNSAIGMPHILICAIRLLAYHTVIVVPPRAVVSGASTGISLLVASLPASGVWTRWLFCTCDCRFKMKINQLEAGLASRCTASTGLCSGVREGGRMVTAKASKRYENQPTNQPNKQTNQIKTNQTKQKSKSNNNKQN